MPRNGSGTYSLPAGNPVVAGDVIEAAWANTTLSDVANELTNSLSRNGNGGMLAPFRVADGSVSAPGLGFTNETNTGLYRAGSGEIWLTVGGIAVAQVTVNGLLIPAGKRITLPAPVNTTDAANKVYVDDLVNPVIQYANYYLGPKSSDPLVNNSGGALTAGTTYWSTTLDQMRVYNGTNWEPMPSTSSLIGQTFSGTGAQTAFTMANPSGPAVNLEVFISGVRQVPTTDYTVSNNILTFTSAPPVGTNNIFIRYAQLMQSSGNLQTVVQNITATAGQTAFSLSSSYQPGTNNLGVYVNGLRLVPGTDYTETSSTTLTMASGATAGDEFMFVIGDEISESISSVNVSYTPAGTGAVPTSVQTKLRESVSVKDFGAVGDGVADDTAAIQLALNSGATLVTARGAFLLGSSILLPDNVMFDCRGSTFLANSNGLTLIKNAGTSSYFSQVWGGAWDGNGKSSVVAMDFNNMRVSAGIFNPHWKDCSVGLISRNGMFGAVVLNPGSERVPAPIQVLANASTLAIINPSFDNSPSLGGTGLGIGVDIRAGAGDNIGVRVEGGYIQGFASGIKDAGIKTIVSDVYFEKNTYDLEAVAARASHYSKIQLYGPSGTAGFRLRNCDAITIADPTMASGARTGMFDADGTNTNCRAHMVGSNAALNTPIGTVTGILLTDYTLGFTVTDASVASLTLTQNKQAYRSTHGLRTTIDVDITYPVTASGALASISLPISARSGSAVSGACGYTDYGSAVFIDGSGASVNFYNAAGAALANSNLSGKRLAFSLSYLTQ